MNNLKTFKQYEMMRPWKTKWDVSSTYLYDETNICPKVLRLIDDIVLFDATNNIQIIREPIIKNTSINRKLTWIEIWNEIDTMFNNNDHTDSSGKVHNVIKKICHTGNGEYNVYLSL